MEIWEEKFPFKDHAADYISFSEIILSENSPSRLPSNSHTRFLSLSLSVGIHSPRFLSKREGEGEEKKSEKDEKLEKGWDQKRM